MADMDVEYLNAAKAEEEAKNLTNCMAQKINKVVKDLQKSLQELKYIKGILDVDPDCVCGYSQHKPRPEWDARQRLHQSASYLQKKLREAVREEIPDLGYLTSQTDIKDNCYVENIGPMTLGKVVGDSIPLEDDTVSWCNRVCILQKVNMEPSLWGKLPQMLMELVFAHLPLHCIFRLRVLSKQWKEFIASPAFQQAFESSQTERFGILPRRGQRKAWIFGTSEKMWYALSMLFLPPEFGVLGAVIAADGGLICYESCVTDGRGLTDLLVCNPLTRTFRKLPSPQHVRVLKVAQLVIDLKTKHYSLILGGKSDVMQPILTEVEIYSSFTNSWKSCGAHESLLSNNYTYYLERAWDGFGSALLHDFHKQISTSVPLPPEVSHSQSNGFSPLCEYQGHLFLLRTISGESGIWELAPPNEGWRLVCSVPTPNKTDCYFVSLFVNRNLFVLLGQKRVLIEPDVEEHSIEDDNEDELEDCLIMTYDKDWKLWLDCVDDSPEPGPHLAYLTRFMFQPRLDSMP